MQFNAQSFRRRSTFRRRARGAISEDECAETKATESHQRVDDLSDEAAAAAASGVSRNENN